PSTAAITGLGQSMIARQYFCTLRDMTSTGPASAISPISAPAAKATSDPVTITQRTLLSAPQRVISSASRTRTSRLSALRTCGRLILKTTMSSVGCSTSRDSGAAMTINPDDLRSTRFLARDQEADAGYLAPEFTTASASTTPAPTSLRVPGTR